MKAKWEEVLRKFLDKLRELSKLNNIIFVAAFVLGIIVFRSMFGLNITYTTNSGDTFYVSNFIFGGKIQTYLKLTDYPTKYGNLSGTFSAYITGKTFPFMLLSFLAFIIPLLAGIGSMFIYLFKPDRKYVSLICWGGAALLAVSAVILFLTPAMARGTLNSLMDITDSSPDIYSKGIITSGIFSVLMAAGFIATQKLKEIDISDKAKDLAEKAKETVKSAADTVVKNLHK